ncbi:MAG: hypothetical protein ACT4OO_03510 [Nitrospiraceae bacterium]
MRRSIRFAGLFWLLILLAWIGGCTGPAPTAAPQRTAVPISDFRTIAGKWEGLMIREPRSRREDWVRVTIQEDGRFDFTSYRTIGVFSGSGQFSLNEGKVTAHEERGTLTCTLYESHGRRLLEVTGVAKDGLQYSAELTPAR